METRIVMKFHPRIAPIKVRVPAAEEQTELVKKATRCAICCGRT